MRGNGVAGRPSSAGGTASSTRQTSPSAGATTSPGRVGGTRGGCRKNAALATADASPARRSHGLLRPIAATARLTPTNGRPSRCIGGTADRTSAMIRAGPWRSGRLAIVQRFSRAGCPRQGLPRIGSWWDFIRIPGSGAVAHQRQAGLGDLAACRNPRRAPRRLPGPRSCRTRWSQGQAAAEQPVGTSILAQPARLSSPVKACWVVVETR